MNKSSIVVAPALALVVALSGCAMNRERVTAKVTKTERACFKSNDCRNMVNTDKGNFQVTDTASRKNSYDVYSKIEVGKTYEFTVEGARRPERSEFPNIIDSSLR